MKDREPQYPPEYDYDDFDIDEEPSKAYCETMDMLERIYGTRDYPLIKRGFYKYTDCGGWIKIDDAQVTIGSIVEGAEADAITLKLRHPVSEKQFNDAVQQLEDSATEIWNEWNE